MKRRTLILSFLALVFVYTNANAQTSFTIAETGSKVTVSGTSNLHDYTLVSEEIKGSADLFMEDGKVTDIK
ncbi:MAG: hypothetical protein HWE07_13210, partial [Cytophagia bacterium]|nr:hypothetical protein [Cytophagia bacterium]